MAGEHTGGAEMGWANGGQDRAGMDFCPRERS